MKAPYTQFGKTYMLPVVTFTNGVKDDPPSHTWDEEMWIERGEDWYAFLNPEVKRKTIRVVEREQWLKARRRDEVRPV